MCHVLWQWIFCGNWLTIFECIHTLTMSQCAHWLVQCTLECHWNATGWPSVHCDTTGWPSEYLQGTLEHHWKNLVETAHNEMPLEKLTFAAYTETPLEGLWQPTQAPTPIVKHAQKHPYQFEMTRWRDTSKQVDRSLYIQPLLYCSAIDASSALNTCEYFNITLCMSLIWASLQFYCVFGVASQMKSVEFKQL